MRACLLGHGCVISWEQHRTPGTPPPLRHFTQRGNAWSDHRNWWGARFSLPPPALGPGASEPTSVAVHRALGSQPFRRNQQSGSQWRHCSGSNLWQAQALSGGGLASFHRNCTGVASNHRVPGQPASASHLACTADREDPGLVAGFGAAAVLVHCSSVIRPDSAVLHAMDCRSSARRLRQRPADRAGHWIRAGTAATGLYRADPRPSGHLSVKQAQPAMDRQRLSTPAALAPWTSSRSAIWAMSLHGWEAFKPSRKR